MCDAGKQAKCKGAKGVKACGMEYLVQMTRLLTDLKQKHPGMDCKWHMQEAHRLRHVTVSGEVKASAEGRRRPEYTAEETRAQNNARKSAEKCI